MGLVACARISLLYLFSSIIRQTRFALVSWALRGVYGTFVGLVILVVVAFVVAAIAAAFGVILTAWAAIMIAGAILFAAGFVFALIQRSPQEAYR